MCLAYLRSNEIEAETLRATYILCTYLNSSFYEIWSTSIYVCWDIISVPWSTELPNSLQNAIGKCCSNYNLMWSGNSNNKTFPLLSALKGFNEKIRLSPIYSFHWQPCISLIVDTHSISGEIQSVISHNFEEWIKWYIDIMFVSI